jgi:hypothetical protein
MLWNDMGPNLFFKDGGAVAEKELRQQIAIYHVDQL